jgi:hypothetical protein
MKAATTGFTLAGRHSRRLWTVVCLALFLALQLFSASSSLHRAIHPDAASPAHQCVITLWSHGQVDVPGVSLACVIFVAALLFFLPSLPAAVPSSFDYRLSPSRAPPAS